MNFLLGVVISYLLGSIPTAYIFGKLYQGIDIRQHGSGNVGATNTFRVLGKIPGTIVLLIDILKGTLALTVVGDLFSCDALLQRILLGVAAIVGHNWTIFLQFKGGKGVATTLGVLIGLTIKFSALLPVLLMCVLTWIVFFIFSGYVSLASVIAAIVLPITMIFTGQPLLLVLVGIIFCIFVVVRHRPNIERLLSGKESRIKLFKK